MPQSTPTKVARYKVPFVVITIPDRKGNTTRTVNVPLYELPIYEIVYQGALQPGTHVEVSAVPDTLPPDFHFRYASRAEEETRMRNRWGKHPVTKVPLFDDVYGFGKFKDAYARVVEGKYTLADVLAERNAMAGGDDDALDAETEDTALDAEYTTNADVVAGNEKAIEKAQQDDVRDSAIYNLKKVRGIGPALAADIYDAMGYTSVEEIADALPGELETAGISPAQATKITAAAKALVAELAPAEEATDIYAAAAAADDDDDDDNEE